MDYSTEPLLNIEILIAIVTASIGFFLFLAFIINFYLPFKEDRDYIKQEMERSFDEEEYRYWQRELKRLYLRSIPLIGRFFK